MPPNNFGAARAATKKRKLAALDKAALLAPVASTSAPPAAAPAARPPKRRLERAVNLKWRNVVLPSEIGFDEDGGMLELDEIEGVNVVYNEGRIQFEVGWGGGRQGGGANAREDGADDLIACCGGCAGEG